MFHHGGQKKRQTNPFCLLGNSFINFHIHKIWIWLKRTKFVRFYLFVSSGDIYLFEIFKWPSKNSLIHFYKRQDIVNEHRTDDYAKTDTVKDDGRPWSVPASSPSSGSSWSAWWSGPPSWFLIVFLGRGHSLCLESLVWLMALDLLLILVEGPGLTLKEGVWQTGNTPV